MDLRTYVSTLTDALNNELIEQRQQLMDTTDKLRAFAEETERLRQELRWEGPLAGAPNYRKRNKARARQARRSRKRNR